MMGMKMAFFPYADGNGKARAAAWCRAKCTSLA